MSAYEKPIEDLAIFNPEAFTANDVPLTVTTGAKYFLKYPFAQGTENLQSFNSNGTARFTGSTAPTNTIKNDSIVLSNGSGISTTQTFNQLNSNGQINLTATSFIYDGGIINSSSNIASRYITSGYFYISDVSLGASTSSPTVQIYNNNANCYFQHLQNNGNINFFVNDASGSQIGTVQITPNNLNVRRSLVMSVDQSILLSGQGTITQPFISSTNPLYNTTTNTLRRTFFNMDCSSSIAGSNVGSSRTPVEITDSNANASSRGFYFLPNTSISAFNPINRVGDSSICAKGNNYGYSTLTSYSNFKNGFRVGATDATNCNLSIECGPYEALTMAYNSVTGITTTQFNDVFGFRAINGTSSFTNFYHDPTATVPGMYLDCSLTNGSFNFTVQDNVGVKSTPFVISSGLTSYLNTLSVRSAITPSNRFDISTDNLQTTSIRCRTTNASTVGTININCDSVSAGGAVTNTAVMTLNPTSVTCNKSILFNYSTLNGTVLNQLGGVFTAPISSTTYTTSSANVVRFVDSFSAPYTGTYLIIWTFQLVSQASTIIPSDLRFCISKLNNSFNAGDEAYVSFINPSSVAYPSIGTSSPALMLNTSCTVRLASSTPIFFNYYTVWTGNPTAILGGQYSVTRIG